MTAADPPAEPGPHEPRPTGANWVVESEFATVGVTVDSRGNGPRLRLEDLRTGVVRYLDALELESIVWAPEQSMRDLLDPSRHRWRDADPGPAAESLRGTGPEPAGS